MLSPCKFGHERRLLPCNRPYCSECQKKRSKKYIKNHRNKISLKRKAHYQKNRERILLKQKENSTVKQEYDKKYYQRNKKRIEIRGKKYYLNNKDKWEHRRLTQHPLKDVYGNMIKRCYHPSSDSFKNYGGRRVNPIKVCDRWLGPDGFKNFCEDMYPTYQKGLTIDRIDVNGNYEPNNCRWITAKEQCQNRRTYLKYRLSIPDNSPMYVDGKLSTLQIWAEQHNMPLIIARYRYALHALDEKWMLDTSVENRYYKWNNHYYNVVELSLIAGITYSIMRYRIVIKRWSISDALTTPINSKYNSKQKAG